LIARIVEKGDLRRTDKPDEIRAAAAAGLPIWLDLDERTPEIDRLLVEAFHIHAVTLEDIWVDRIVPKVEQIDDNLHILVQGVTRTSAGAMQSWSANIVLGKTYVITNGGPRGELPRCRELLAESPALVAHAILDRIVDSQVALVDELGRVLDKMDEEIFGPHDAGASIRPLAGRLFALRRSMQKLGRGTQRQLDAIRVLADGSLAAIPLTARPYFRDVLDHFTRVADLVSDYEGQIADSLEALVQSQAGRLNLVMKTLAVVSTVMLPLTLIASIFGMNFRHMPLVGDPWGFGISLAAMLVIAVSLVAFFKGKRWL
jgi:magnesium transporter